MKEITKSNSYLCSLEGLYKNKSFLYYEVAFKYLDFCKISLYNVVVRGHWLAIRCVYREGAM